MISWLCTVCTQHASRGGVAPLWRDGKGRDTSFFAHMIYKFFGHFSPFLPICHWILPIVSPVPEIFKTPGMAIAMPAILVSPPLHASIHLNHPGSLSNVLWRHFNQPKPLFLGVFCLSCSDIPITMIIMIISLTRVFVSADKTIVPPTESEVQHRHQEAGAEARVPRRACGRHSGQGE